MMQEVFGLYNYWIVIFLMMTGFYIVIARTNLIQKVIGLNIFQISVFLLYITMGKVTGGTAPILQELHGHAHGAHVAEHHDESAKHGVTQHATEGDQTEKADAQTESHADTESSHQGADVAKTSDSSQQPIEHDGAEHAQAEHDVDEHSQPHGTPVVYTHPLPSVLMLTAIVVGVATTAVALALIIRIGEAYGTIEEDEILQLDRETT